MQQETCMKYLVTCRLHVGYAHFPGKIWLKFVIEFHVLKLSLSKQLQVHDLNFTCATKIPLYALPYKENRDSTIWSAGGAFIPTPYIFYFQSLSLPAVWIFVTFLSQPPTINLVVLCLENKWNLQFFWYIWNIYFLYVST